MFFKIKMPIIEDLMDWLDSDDNDWADIARPRELMLKGDGCTCWCLGVDTNTAWAARMDSHT